MNKSSPWQWDVHLRDTIYSMSVKSSLMLKGSVLTSRNPISIPMAHARLPYPRNGRFRWRLAAGFRRTPVPKSCMNWKRCHLLSGRWFPRQHSFGIRSPLLYGHRFSNVLQSGNQYWFSIRTPVSKCTTTLKPASRYHVDPSFRLYHSSKTGMQYFVAPISNFIPFLEPASSIP